MVLGDDGFHIFGSSIPVTPGKGSVPEIPITEQQRESINTVSQPHQEGQTQYSNGNSDFFDLYVGNSSQPYQGGATPYSNGNPQLFDFNIGSSSQSYQGGPGQIHHYSNGNSSHSYQGLGQRHQYPNGNPRYWDFNIDPSYTRSILGNLSQQDGYSSGLTRNDMTSASSNSLATTHINGFPFMIPPNTNNTNYQQQQHTSQMTEFAAEQNTITARSISGGGHRQGIQLCFGETGAKVPYVGFSLQHQRSVINFKNPTNTNHLGPITPEQFSLSQTRKKSQVERENYTDPKIKETIETSIHESNSNTLDLPADLGHQKNIPTTIEESQNREEDLNTTTPIQKPRRKKHRPKVIKESKTPRNPKRVDTPKGKRTPRKKKEEHSSERPSNEEEEETPIKRQRTVRTRAKRTLSFDNKELQLNDNESRSSTIARSNCNKDFLPEENSFKKSENSEVSNVDVKISQTLRRHNIRENMKALAREKGKEHNYHKNSDVLHKINEHNYNGITTHRDIDHIPNAAKKMRTNKSVSAGNGLNEICEVMIMQQNIIGTSFNQCPLDSKHPLFGYQTQEGFQSLMESLNSTALKVPRKRRSGKKNTNPYKTGGPVIPKVDLIDLITEKLQNMNINASSDGISHQELQKENAMVVYNRSSAMVPFFTPRKKPARAKVDLDSETNRVWMVLMGKNNGDCPEGADFDKKKWWEEERRVFQGRANSFIARMHLVQGDRRFSRWKGSVVDSVVGVFLTQNVSDHLSSSAFMSLVAKFPNCTRAEHAKPRSTEEYIVSFTEDEDISVKEGCDQNKTLEDQLNQNHHGIDPNKELTSIHEESIIIHEEESTIIQEEGSTIIQEEGSTTIHEEEKRINMLNYTECTLKSSGTTNFHETDDMRSIESTLSSQHSSESPVQALDQIGSGSALYVEEDIINGNSFDNMHMRTSFTELLQMAKDKVLQDYHPSKNENNTKEPGHDFEGVISSAPSDSSTPLQDVFYWHNHSHNLNKMGSEIRIDSVQSETEQFFQKKDDVTVSETHSNPINHPNNSEFTGSLGLKKEHKSSMPPKIVEISLNDQKVREEGNKAKAKTVKKPPENIDWDSLRRETYCDGVKEERNPDNIDSIDWEAIRRAPVGEIANIIRDRGMNNMLAERIKGFLDRLVRDHGSVDLEWLRDAPPDKVKDYLLSFRGLGLKSVECVRLLSLEHLAFPVDTNVGRICVRLGWVPLQPLPESLQLHLLEMYPMLETIQKYLWPRLCTLDQRTLYELHYQLITFGKVFCTKTKPNCNACPMRGECKHFASAFASARLALPGPEEKGLVASTDQILSNHGHKPFTSQAGPLQLEGTQEPPLQIEVAQVPPLQIDVTQRFPLQLEGTQILKEPNTCQPIIEEVLTPEPEPVDIPEWAIEDGFYEDPDEIPTIALNIEQLTQNVQNILHENEALLQNGDMSNALVALTPEAASIPQPKLKNVSRLRTEHLVYELPDGHPLLNNLDRREPDDPSPYLLAIWTPGETAQSTELPETICNSSSNGGVCDKSNCFSCSSIKEAQSQKVRGTLLIPCRTAMRGSFPLNGTYFQVNEVFADHASSIVPMDVPRRWIWSLTRRTVYFGTSVTSIFRGLTTEGIQQCFWRGFVCVRGFDQKTRAPRPLLARLHFSENRVVRNNKKNADNLKEQKKTS